MSQFQKNVNRAFAVEKERKRLQTNSMNMPIRLTAAMTFLLVSCCEILVYAKDKEPVLMKFETTIDASTDSAWIVLGVGYAEISSWSSDVKESEPMDQQSLNGSLCTVRKCKVKGLGTVEEKLVAYSDANHQLKYEVVSGLPGMIKYVFGSWILTDMGNGKTKLNLEVEMKPDGFWGGLLKGSIRRKMNRLYGKAVEEFKYVVEHASPHSRKKS